MLDVLVVEFDLGRLDGLIDALRLVQADNRTHVLLAQRPRNRHLSHALTHLLADLLDAADDLLVDFVVSRPHQNLEVVVRLLAQRVSAGIRAGQGAAGHGRPGDQADARVVAVGDHLVLLLAVDQVVVVLHGDELVPAVALGDVLELLELPRRHARGPDVADLAGLDDVVQRPHDLLPGHGAVESVDLQHVDVRPQPGDALVHRVNNVFPAEADLVEHVVVVDRAHGDVVRRCVGSHAEVAFTQDHQILPRDLVLGDGLADDAFRLAVRVDVGRVPCPDPGLVGVFEQWEGFFFVEHPSLPVRRAVTHRSTGQLIRLEGL